MNYSSIKYKHVMEYLIEQIKDGVLKPGDKLSSIKELCDIFGYSSANIKLALKNLEEHKYIVKEKRGCYLIADKIPKNITNNISIITPYILNPQREQIETDVRPQLIMELENAITKNGYNARIKITNHDKYINEHYLSKLEKGNVDGIIYYNNTDPFSTDILERYEKNNMPIVFVGYYNKTINIPAISSNNNLAIQRLIEEYLIPNGYDRIFCVTTTSIDSNLKERENGYKEAINKHNITREIIYIPEDVMEYNSYTKGLITDHINRLYHNNLFPEKKTAVIFLQPYLTRMLWRYFQEEKLILDSFCWCSVYDPKIDFPDCTEHIEITHDLDKIAQTAVETIIDMTNDKFSSEKMIYIPYHIVASEHFNKKS